MYNPPNCKIAYFNIAKNVKSPKLGMWAIMCFSME